jgi:hypothetical protein
MSDTSYDTLLISGHLFSFFLFSLSFAFRKVYIM